MIAANTSHAKRPIGALLSLCVCVCVISGEEVKVHSDLPPPTEVLNFLHLNGKCDRLTAVLQQDNVCVCVCVCVSLTIMIRQLAIHKSNPQYLLST